MAQTAPKPWNYNSAVAKCETCEGHGGIWNGRGLGGNDPDSYAVDCEDCEATGIIPCEVCGFEQHVAGYDCIVCEMVSNVPDKMLTDAVQAELIGAIKLAWKAAKADAQVQA